MPGLVVSLDDRAADYIRDLERQTRHKVKWYDMYLEQAHLRNNPRYHKYKISVRVGRVTYDMATSMVEKPGQIFTQWYHNNGSSSLDATFTKSTEYKSQFSWSNTKSLKVGVSATISVGIPGVFGGSSTFTSEMSIGSTVTTTETRTDTYSIAQKVVVKPSRSAKATFTVNEREATVPYQAEVFISGWIAIWFEEKYEGHWLWFYPIERLANEDFKNDGNGELVFNEKGEFRGVRGVDTTFRVEEYPLMEGIQQGDMDVPTGEPRLIVDHRTPDKFSVAAPVAAALLE